MRMKMLLLFLAIKLLCGIFTTCEGQSSFPPKNATQQNTWGSSAAGRAIDGNPYTCSLSAFAPGSSEYGWWQVDLRDVFTVNSVTVTSGSNDGSDPIYYQNFMISVGMTNNVTAIDSNIGLCYYFNNGSYLNSWIPTTFNCSSPLNGRYVTIKRRGGYRQDAMGLCEVGIQYITVSSSSSSTTSTTSTTSSTSKTSTASTTSTTSTASKPSTMSTISAVSKPSTISTPSDAPTSPAASKSSKMSTTLTTSTISTTSTSLETPASASFTAKTYQASAIIAAIVLGCILGVSLIVILILSIMHHRLRRESKKLQSASSVPKRAADADSINYETMRENDKPPVLSSTGIRNDIMYENEYQRASIYPPDNRNESMYQNNYEM